MTTMKAPRKLMLHSCPRCRGDLVHDDYEDEFVCIQCGRRANLVSGQPVMAQPSAGIQVIAAPPPVRALTRAEARRRHAKAA